MELNNEFQKEIKEMVSKYEIVVAAQKLSSEAQALIDKFKTNEVDARFFKSINAPAQPVLILDAEYVLSYADAEKLIEYQPQKGVLFYHRREYAAYQKAGEYLLKAEHAYEEYDLFNWQFIRRDNCDQLDEDQASIMQMIDNYEEDNNFKIKYSEQQKLLFDAGNDASGLKVDLPY